MSWLDISTPGWGVLVDEKGIQVIEMSTGKAHRLRLEKAERAFMIAPGVLLVRLNAAVKFLDAKTGKGKDALLEIGQDDEADDAEAYLEAFKALPKDSTTS